MPKNPQNRLYSIFICIYKRKHVSLQTTQKQPTDLNSYSMVYEEYSEVNEPHFPWIESGQWTCERAATPANLPGYGAHSCSNIFKVCPSIVITVLRGQGSEKDIQSIYNWHLPFSKVLSVCVASFLGFSFGLLHLQRGPHASVRSFEPFQAHDS